MGESLHMLCVLVWHWHTLTPLCVYFACVFSERHGAPERPADESAGEDEGCEARCWDTPSAPLSTACLSLDHTLLVHLKNCSSQLLVSRPVPVYTTYT